MLGTTTCASHEYNLFNFKKSISTRTTNKENYANVQHNKKVAKHTPEDLIYIWKAKASFKIKAFFWPLVLDRLNAIDMLSVANYIGFL